MNNREATYAQSLETPYEQTQWQILVDGKIIPRIVSFQLDQRFNAHHIFTLRIHHAELEEARNYRIDNTRFLFGKRLIATMGSTLEADRVQFQGVITRVSLTHNQGLNGDLIIEGYSPTILLESGKHLSSFYKQSLESIAKTITSALSGKLEVAYAIRFQQALPYVTQYA